MITMQTVHLTYKILQWLLHQQFKVLIALLITYLFGIPAGMVMAANKGKWQDKLGTVYINIMSAVPSLAFIYFVRSIG